MADKEILDKLESWLENRYKGYVDCFRAVDDSLYAYGPRALEVMKIRIKLSELIEEACGGGGKGEVKKSGV